MPRARWFVIGFLLMTGAVGTVLSAPGPFPTHPGLAYEQFLADFQAGRVEQIVQWRDRLEVTEGGTLRSVVVLPDRDLGADLALARSLGGVGISHRSIPDDRLVSMTPWVPVWLALAGGLIWAGAVVRNRRIGSGSGAAATRYAGS